MQWFFKGFFVESDAFFKSKDSWVSYGNEFYLNLSTINKIRHCSNVRCANTGTSAYAGPNSICLEQKLAEIPSVPLVNRDLQFNVIAKKNVQKG